jgi:hypothetical protein
MSLLVVHNMINILNILYKYNLYKKSNITHNQTIWTNIVIIIIIIISGDKSKCIKSILWKTTYYCI